MKKLYSLTVRILTLLIAVTALNQGVVTAMQQHMVTDTSKSKSVRVSESRIGLRTLSSSAVKSNYIPFRPLYANTAGGTMGTQSGQQIDPGIELNVKIYPIPVADEINMSYHLSKDSNVIIELFDILGSKISTLLSRRLSAGEQRNTFPTNSRLITGFYTIRITVGNQQVSRRISKL